MCLEWLVDEEYTWSIMYRTSMADGQGVLISSVAGGLRERRLIGGYVIASLFLPLTFVIRYAKRVLSD